MPERDPDETPPRDGHPDPPPPPPPPAPPWVPPPHDADEDWAYRDLPGDPTTGYEPDPTEDD